MKLVAVAAVAFVALVNLAAWYRSRLPKVRKAILDETWRR